jgi:hypothetical protein
MEIDTNKVVGVLTTATQEIKKASDAAKNGGPLAAMPFVQPIMDNLKEIQSFGKLEGITANTQESERVSQAITSFLKQTDEAEKSAGPMAANLFSSSEVVQVRDNLQLVLKRLKLGGKVEKSEKIGEGN